MGSVYSEERDFDEDSNRRVTSAQQQRARLFFLQQLHEARATQQTIGGNEDLPPLPPVVPDGASGPPEQRPAQQPGLRTSKVYKNPVHLRGKTLAIHDREGDGGAVLRFRFDTTVPSVVIVHRLASLAMGSGGVLAVESAEWSSPPAKFEAGLNHSHEVDWAHKSQDSTAAPSRCPLLIEVRSNVPEAEAAAVTTEWTFACVAAADRVEVIRQQVMCGPDQVLDVMEVFGSEAAADGVTRREVCVVCQFEPCDTAALPCRHMCLCSGCSEYIRTRVQHRSYRCPICRERISRMMRIEGPEEGTGER